MKLACRFCAAPLSHTFADLGMSPLANSYLREDKLEAMEQFYPLHVRVCEKCLLVQLPEFESPEHIFSDYAYFSSISESWLKHCEAYAAQMTGRLSLGKDSLVAEVASNDGYLLQYFAKAGVPVLGIEPAANVAKVAVEKGVPTEVAFFGVKTAERLAAAGRRADLIAANNVLAHVPDINDFVKGFSILLKPAGVVTVEFPHLLNLIQENQFDTIYHEHFSYLSFGVVERIYAAHGLRVFDVDQLPTHGGSLRVYACHAKASQAVHAETARVAKLRELEKNAGLHTLEGHTRTQDRLATLKCEVMSFFANARREGKRVAGYGAPAKGNTLLNYCGIGPELMPFTVDRSPHKQNLYLPGVHIPIRHPDEIARVKPDYVFILPWNLKAEITEQMKQVRAWGGRFVVPIPQVTVLP
jgi:SAM-dependent methyltransferase